MYVRVFGGGVVVGLFIVGGGSGLLILSILIGILVLVILVIVFSDGVLISRFRFVFLIINVCWVIG